MNLHLEQPIAKSHVLVVEDDRAVRDSLASLLVEEGYAVSFAENGRVALGHLHTESLPHVIVLDLRMPVMDGWEFRIRQKDDPALSLIPVVAISADRSAQAAAISAEAYLRKPIDVKEFLGVIERVLFENERRRISVQMQEAERLTSLGRLAAGVGHEINNPLTYLLLNLNHAIEILQPRTSPGQPLLSPQVELDELKARLASVTEMLQDCQVGSDRIRETVTNLQRLSHKGDSKRDLLDVRELVHQAISMSWNHVRHRARLDKRLLPTPPLRGNAGGLVRVFFNLLLNAAQAIPEGDAERNEIRVATKVVGAEIVVEVGDTGVGVSSELLGHLFEPFFTTKGTGQGTGLGLSISRQTVHDHGGRIEVESTPAKGSTFRVWLPIGDSETVRNTASHAASHAASDAASLEDHPTPGRGRVLVIDDEPLIGRTIGTALSNEHDVFVAPHASEAIGRLARGESFDLLLCDVVMPDVSGPEFYRTIAERWPDMVSGLVFMTGGAFTPRTVAFVESVPVTVLPKPFNVDQVKRLVQERMTGARARSPESPESPESSRSSGSPTSRS